MSDPTKQAATAKTAREVIAQAVRAADELRRSLIENAGLSENPWPGSPHALFKDALTALRALLDAPEGGMGRLVEAAEEVIHRMRPHYERIGPETDGSDEPLGGLWSALAALRASPESLGSANVDLVYAERDIVALKRERDTLKADLAAARGEVERVTKERDTDRAQLDALYPARKIVRDGYGTITSWRTTLRPNGDVEAAVAPPTPAYAAADLTQIARMDRIEARVAAVEKTATPPVTEAPISERIGPYAVDEVRVHPDGVFMVTLVGELEAVRSAGARLFEQVWLVADSAAAERAVKAPQAEG